MERFPSMLLQDLVEVWHPNEDLDSDGGIAPGPTALGTTVAANSIRIDGHQLEWTPRSSKVPWVAKVEQMLETLRVFRRGSDFPYEFWPEPGGLVPWADVNGDLLFCWRTVGDDPDAWPVVVADNGVSEWSEFDGTASACLVELLQGTADLPVLAYARDMFLARPIDVQLWQ
ncbi:hypothetical protein FB566_4638 [Stackebrandtia endophytica]|uniref:Uncharacterized protein n=1 Tax=Stackebrandtia endophytica TaxID=1496996 RepID=A0A543B2G7_9ACTN|nr:hypothetical protein [Stackebrandtia endophytica]TQL79037.1 hypothetical protein FB566_4638 [Stackebrandtia endophytica]